MAPSSVTSRHKSWLLRAFIEHLQFQICDFILIMLTVKWLISHVTIWEGAKRPFILLYFILMISLLTWALSNHTFEIAHTRCMNRFSAHFLRNSNIGGNFSNRMWNFELKLHLKRSENGGFLKPPFKTLKTL